MTRIASIATAAALALATLGQPAKAEPIDSLEKCYNAVISWCVKTFPDKDCSKASGLALCDKEFKAHVSGRPGDLRRPGTTTPPDRVDSIIGKILAHERMRQGAGGGRDGTPGRG